MYKNKLNLKEQMEIDLIDKFEKKMNDLDN